MAPTLLPLPKPGNIPVSYGKMRTFLRAWHAAIAFRENGEENGMALKTKITSTHESQALFNRAQEQINRNRHREALHHLRKALEISPYNPHYLSLYGYCLAKERETYDTAIDLCKRALRLKPSDADILVNLGRVQRLSGDNSNAHGTFLRAWEKKKGHSGAATELSRMGVRRRPVLPFLPRSHWSNKYLGMLRAKIERFFQRT
jgi:Flp pilus assembly protein TadD